MREIEFRGLTIPSKRENEAKWVYGHFAHGSISPEEFKYIAVRPETVGQFTGLKDKNGKKIYEGDIVQHGCAGDIFRGEVGWDEEYLEYFLLCTDGESEQLRLGSHDSMEIIGNVHENPELMK